MRVHIVRRPAVAATDLPDSLHPVLRRVYAARGVSTHADLDTRLQAMPDPGRFPGMAQAVLRLERAITDGERILIVGDFDADGATSTALSVLALKAMGAAHVDYLVPNRFDFGYGLSPPLVAVAAGMAPGLIVTVDNGIASIDGVAAAAAAGIDVVITDHHLPGEVLPAACAIVNPQLGDSDVPSKALAGVGVMFFLLAALRRRLRDAGWFGAGRREPNLGQWLDLVAVGTVADVVPLDALNRLLVTHGLARIRSGQCRAAITALLELSGRDCARARAMDIGFTIGPRLNAAGRMDDMTIGIEALLADDPALARELAARLDGLNRERRGVETAMREQAEQAVDALALGDGLPFGLSLFDADWHEGVVGIVASRIKDRWHRPVVAFAPDKDGNLKGSGRSVPGFHLRDALAAVDSRQPGLITRFGGHAMAAGLSLPRAHLDDFSAAFDRQVRSELAAEDLQGRLFTDGELGATELCLDLAERLADGGPWGQGFPEPLFDGVFDVLDQRIVGEHHLKLKVRHGAGGGTLDAIAFRLAERHPRGVDARVHLAYRLDVNEWQGRRSVQLVVEHIGAITPIGE